MAFLARIVARAKWDSAQHGLAEGEIPAEAVTRDLKTTENALSFWRCGQASDEDLQAAAMAIAASRGDFDRVQLTWLRADALENDGVACEQRDGRTGFVAMIKQHVEAVQLDLVRHGRVAVRVAEALSEERFHTFSRKTVKTMLEKAAQEGSLDPELLGDDLRKKLFVHG